MICLVDNSEHPDRESLHKHLRTLKVKQETYYTQFDPRRDRFTGEVIPFKAPVERYLATEFSHKRNLKAWIKKDSPEAREWAVNWLRKRKADKSLTTPPTQVELRSLMAPTRAYYDHVWGYNKLCAELGYTVRFDRDVAPAELPKDAVVIVDTREQNALKLTCANRRDTVKSGDYAFAPPHDLGIYIERKSIQDLMGTMSDRNVARGGTNDSALSRFARELERADEVGGYIIMLVEVDINDALGIGFNGIPTHGYMNADHLFHNLRGLLHRHHNFQVLFVAGRKEAAAAVPKLLSMGDSVRRIDLQYEYERGTLTF